MIALKLMVNKRFKCQEWVNMLCTKIIKEKYSHRFLSMLILKEF